MSERIDTLMKDFDRNPGASDQTLQLLNDAVGGRLPTDYIDWMRASNGGEGFLGPISYLMVWPVDELLERNRRLEISQRMPGVILFGSNGGDAAFGFDMRSTPSIRVVEIPYVDIGTVPGRVRATGFIELLEAVAAEV